MIIKTKILGAYYMKTFTHTVTDEYGIHARPAGQIVNLAKKTEDTIIIKKGDKEADAGKLFALMGLGAKMGDTLVFEIEGKTEDETFKLIYEYVKENI